MCVGDLGLAAPSALLSPVLSKPKTSNPAISKPQEGLYSNLPSLGRRVKPVPLAGLLSLRSCYNPSGDPTLTQHTPAQFKMN